MKPVILFCLSLFCLDLSNAQSLVNSEFISRLTREDVASLLNNVTEFEYDISMYKLQYTTPDLDGGIDTASGLVVVPDLPGAIFPKLLFQRGTSNDRWENDLFDWKPEAPIRLLYCEGDDRVPFQNSIIAEATMLANGAPDLQAININSNLDHRQCAEPAALAAALFFENFKMLVPDEEPQQAVSNIEIYPNPTQEYFRLKNVPVDAELYLFDANGRVLLSENIQESPATISIAHLPAGYYSVKVISKLKNWSGKLITH